MSEHPRLRKGCLGTVVVVVLLAVAVVLTLHVAPSLGVVRNTVEDVVESALRAELTVGELDGSLLTGVSARDVELTTLDGVRVAQVDRLDAELGWGALFGRDIEVDLTVEGARLFVVREEDGAMNLLSILPPVDDEPSSDSPVSIDLSYQIEGLAVVWRDRGARSDAELGPLSTADEVVAWIESLAPDPAIARQAPHTIALGDGRLEGRLTVARDGQTDVQVASLSGDAAAAGITESRRLEVGDFALRITGDEQTQMQLSVRRLDLNGWATIEELAASFDPERLEQARVSVAKLVGRQQLLERAVPEMGATTGLELSIAAAPTDGETELVADLTPVGDEGRLRLAARIGGWLEPGPETTWSVHGKAEGLRYSKLFTVAALVEQGELDFTLEGRGVDPNTLEATSQVGVRGAVVDRYRFSALHVGVTMSEGVVRASPLVVETPYVAAAVEAGFSLGGGEFDLRAVVASSDDVAEVGRRLFGQKIDTRADIEIDLEGALDLDAEDPVAIVRSLQGDASWRIRGFTAEDIRVGSTHGDVDVRVSSEGDRRRVRLDVTARGERIRAEGLSLGSFDVRADGRSTVQVPSLDARNALGGLTARVDASIDGLVWDGSLLRKAAVDLRVRPRGGRLAYDVSGSIEKAAFGGTQIDDGAVALKGDVRLGRRLAWPGAVRALSAKGDTSLRGLRLQGESAGTLDVSIDVSGPLDDLGGSVGARAAALAVAGYRFETLNADLAFTGDREFRVEADGTQVDAQPENLGIFIRGRYRRDLTDFTILELRFTSAGDSWNVSEGFSFDTKSGTYRFDDVTLSRGGQRIRVDGVFEMGDRQDVRVETEAVDLGGLDEQFGIAALEPLRGTLDGTAEIGGTAKKPTATFDLHLVDVYWGEYGPFEIRAKGRYADLQLHLEKIAVDGYGARLLEGHVMLPIRLEADGDFELLADDDLDLVLKADDLPVATAYPIVEDLKEWGAGGTLDYRIKAKGTPDDPVVSLQLTGSELGASRTERGKEFEIGPARLEVELDYLSPDNPRGGMDGMVRLEFPDQEPLVVRSRLRAPVDDWVLEFVAGEEFDWVKRFESVPWDFSIDSSRFNLQKVRLGALREADAEGFVTMDVSGKGTLADPQIAIDVALEEFGWERYRDVFVDLDADLNNTRLTLEKLDLEWDADEILSASGQIPTPFEALFGEGEIGDLPLQLVVELKELPIAKFSAVDYTFASLRGQIGAYLRLDGTLKAPTIDGRVSAINVEVSDRTVGTLAAEVGYAEGRASAEVTVCSGAREMLVATADVPVGLDFVRLAEGEPIPIDGEIRGAVKGKNVYLARLVPRKILDDYVTNVGGEMNVDLEIGGTAEKPTLDGTMNLRNGQVFIVQYSRQFDDVRLDLDADPGRLALREFHVGDRNGSVEASGTLEVEGFAPGRVDAEMSLREFGTSGFTDFPTFITANIDVGGDFSGGTADAEATISELEVVVPDTGTRETHPTELAPDIVVLRRSTRSQLEDAFDVGDYQPSAKQTYATLDVVIEQNSWVRHPQGQVEVMGDVQVELVGTSVLLGGEIRTVRGSADVLGKRFEIAKGIITFTGADPPDPRLQVEAVYEFDRSITRAIGQPTSGEPRAIVRVTGRSSDPQLRFLSDPQMPESDVIYALITNQPPNQQEVGQTQGEGLAAGAASGLAAGLLEDKLGEILPFEFDVVRVEAGDEGFADPSVEVGKYIFEDVFFSIEYKIGAEQNENTSEFNIEYRFLPRWIFEFTAGNLGTGEANVFWEVY